MRLVVRVHPRSSRNTLRADASGSAEIWTTAPPAEGQANEAVCRLVAEWLGVAVSDVRIVAGAKGRTKTLDVEGVASLPSSRPEAPKKSRNRLHEPL